MDWSDFTVPSICYPTNVLVFLVMWLGLTTTHRQAWHFSSTSMYLSADLLTAGGIVHLVVHGTSGSTSYEMIPPIQLESSGGVLSAVDMVVQLCDGPRQLWDHDFDDDDDDMCRVYVSYTITCMCVIVQQELMKTPLYKCWETDLWISGWRLLRHLKLCLER